MSGEPEKINDPETTAPSTRLDNLSDRFKKTATGIAMAAEIGIPGMRSACPLFDAWITKRESPVRWERRQNVNFHGIRADGGFRLPPAR
ncbi:MULTISPECIES: DUF4276 family protein [Desulfococcus]|uniref:DUF4276 family protein n=1 Tax=Desulfococcus TaxID=896 RepID=UPI0008A6CE03|nr:uncharacterized protein Dmul_30030 [Desulfococcus multivorans]